MRSEVKRSSPHNPI